VSCDRERRGGGSAPIPESKLEPRVGEPRINTGLEGLGEDTAPWSGRYDGSAVLAVFVGGGFILRGGAI